MLAADPAFRVVAVRRPGSTPLPGIETVGIDLSAADAASRLLALRPDAVVSAAPLFSVSAALRALAGPPGIRVVACSSMSAVSKAGSAVPADRRVAALLLAGEADLLGGLAAEPPLVIRPTMIYGDPATANVARMQRFARRRGFLPRPSGRTGLRQPLHADDLAAALVAAVRPGAPAGVMELGGGSRIPFGGMVEAIARAEGVRVVVVPAWGASAAGRVAGALRVPGAGALYRLCQDQVADNACAEATLGVRPRPFLPLREEA